MSDEKQSWRRKVEPLSRPVSGITETGSKTDRQLKTMPKRSLSYHSVSTSATSSVKEELFAAWSIPGKVSPPRSMKLLEAFYAGR